MCCGSKRLVNAAIGNSKRLFYFGRDPGFFFFFTGDIFGNRRHISRIMNKLCDILILFFSVFWFHVIVSSLLIMDASHIEVAYSHITQMVASKIDQKWKTIRDQGTLCLLLLVLIDGICPCQSLQRKDIH